MPLLAQLVVEYVADVSKLTSGVQAASNSMKSVNQSAESGASALRGFAEGAAVLAGTALIGIGVASTKMAADFQSGMTSLETGAGESAKNIKQVSDGILALAPATATSTKSLTDGMYMIESAGFHGADGLNVLKNAAEGAKVGNAQLKDVANGVTTALTDYGMSADKSASVTNDLIATVASGKTTMGSLASSLKSILPIASSAGISLGDVSAAMATMTGEGVPAGQAANYLKTTVLALEAPASKGAAALKNIGLSSQDVATAMKTSLPSALQMITDHLKTKFPEGSAAYMSALKDITGGSSALSTMLDLTGTHMSTFKGNVDNIANAVKSGGSSITGWSKVQQYFNFQMDKGREVVETMGIKLGTALLPKVGELLSKIMPTITQFGNWLISSHVLENAFYALSNAIGGVVSVGTNIITFFQNNHAALALLQASLPTVAGLIGGALVAAFYLAAEAAWTAAAGFLAFAWPFILVGGLIAGVVAGFILLYNNVAPVRDALNNLGNALKAVYGFFTQTQLGGDILIGVLSGIGVALLSAAIPAIITFVTATIPALVASFFAGAAAAWTMAAGVIAATWPFILIGLVVAAVVVGIVLAIQHWGAIVAWLQGVWGAFSGWFMGALGAIGSFFHAVWNGIVVGIQVAWNFIVNAVKIGVTILLAVLFAPVIAIAALFIWLYNHNIYFKMLVDAIVNFFKGCFAWLQGAWTATINWLGGVWNGVVGIASAAWGAVSGAVMAVVNTVIGWLQAAWNTEVRGMSIIWNTLSGYAQTAWNAVTGVFSSVWGTISGILGGLWSSISGWFSNLAGQFLTWGGNVISQFIQGIKDKIAGIGTALAGAAQTVANFLGFHSPTKEGPGRDADKWAPNFVNMYSNGLLNGIPQIQDAVDNLVKPVAIGVKGAGVGTANTRSTPLQGAPTVIVNNETHVHLDSHEMTNTVMNNVKKELRGHGLKK